MKEHPPLPEGDERIFTFSDVKQLYMRKRKNLLRIFFIVGFFAFAFFIAKAPKYKIEATFKEGAEKNGGEGIFTSIFSEINFGQPQAAALMKSFQVLNPLIKTLGLQVQVLHEGFIGKVYRRFCDNWKAEWQKPIEDINSFGFQNVLYEGEQTIAYGLRFGDPNHFSILGADEKPVTVGTVGRETALPQMKWTLVKTPKDLCLNHTYRLEISPWLGIAKQLRSQLHVVSDKVNKAIYDLSLFHRDRHLGSRLLNELMAEYQRYLKRDHDQIAKEQLAYLEKRQDQFCQKLSNLFEEHAACLRSNLKENGFMGFEEEMKTFFLPHHEMMNKLITIDVELMRLDQLEKGEHPTAPADESPFSKKLSEIARAIQDLKQKRDFLELSLQHRPSPFPIAHYLEEKRKELQEIRLRREKAQELFDAFEKGEIASTLSFDPEKSLALWAEQLKGSQERERADFADYLGTHIRLLDVREKILQERFFYGDFNPREFEGIDLDTARSLFVTYNSKLDQSEAAMRHYAQLKEEIKKADFELGSLSSVLEDPMSQKLIAQASDVALKLKDEKNRSAKEGDRWQEELVLQKKILKDHLEQLFKVEELSALLFREKLVGLQQVSLDCINQQISILNEQASDAIKEQRKALVCERKLLEEKIAALRERASQLPDKWRLEKWLEFRTELGTKIMETLTEVVETKTIGHHLHHVESKPLDFAVPPPLPSKPDLFAKAFFCAFVAVCLSFFFSLIRSILRGFPSSFDKLRAMCYPLLGSISSLCDGPVLEQASGSDLELLRQLHLFLEQAPKSKVIGLLAGRGPDYSFALAENMGRMSKRSLIIRCDFGAKFRAEDQPGLLQMWKGEIKEWPMRKRNGFDVLTAGGFTPYGVEIVQAPFFHQLLETLKKNYDFLFLLFRSPLETAESQTALRLCEKVVVTVSGEPTDLLTPFVTWAYHEDQYRLMFITS